MDERRLKSISNAAESLAELNEAIEKSENLLEKAQLKLLKATLEEELKEAFKELLAEIMNGHPEEAELLKQNIAGNPQKMMELFRSFLQGLADPAKNGEEVIAGLPEEIISIINNPKQSNDTAIEYNPLMTKAMTAAARENKEQVISFSGRSGTDRTMTLKQGHISVYDSFVLNLAVREYRLGNVTSGKEVVFMIDDICRAMTGKKGTPSPKQREDVREALERVRNTLFSFVTSDELAAIIGVEAAEVADRLAGFKGLKAKDLKLHETHLIDKLDIVTRYKRRGKQTTVVIMTFGDVFQNLLDSFPWYQEVEATVNEVQFEKNGVLSDMVYTKDRLALQYYIQRILFAKIRANLAGKKHSNLINYAAMFADCEIDVSTPKQKGRRIETVKQIFADLQRKGYVVNFSEYDTKTEKRAGIKYTTPKFEYMEIEG